MALLDASIQVFDDEERSRASETASPQSSSNTQRKKPSIVMPDYVSLWEEIAAQEKSRIELERFKRFLQAMIVGHQDKIYTDPKNDRVLAGLMFRAMNKFPIVKVDEQNQHVVFKSKNGLININPDIITFQPAPKDGNGKKYKRFDIEDAQRMAWQAAQRTEWLPPNKVKLHGTRTQRYLMQKAIEEQNKFLPEGQRLVPANPVRGISRLFQKAIHRKNADFEKFLSGGNISNDNIPETRTQAEPPSSAQSQAKPPEQKPETTPLDEAKKQFMDDLGPSGIKWTEQDFEKYWSYLEPASQKYFIQKAENAKNEKPGANSHLSAQMEKVACALMNVDEAYKKSKDRTNKLVADIEDTLNRHAAQASDTHYRVYASGDGSTPDIYKMNVVPLGNSTGLNSSVYYAFNGDKAKIIKIDGPDIEYFSSLAKEFNETYREEADVGAKPGNAAPRPDLHPKL